MWQKRHNNKRIQILIHTWASRSKPVFANILNVNSHEMRNDGESIRAKESNTLFRLFFGFQVLKGLLMLNYYQSIFVAFMLMHVQRNTRSIYEQFFSPFFIQWSTYSFLVRAKQTKDSFMFHLLNSLNLHVRWNVNHCNGVCLCLCVHSVCVSLRFLLFTLKNNDHDHVHIILCSVSNAS